jgi:hypothetical protein
MRKAFMVSPINYSSSRQKFSLRQEIHWRVLVLSAFSSAATMLFVAEAIA